MTKESYESINKSNQWSAWHSALFWLTVSLGTLVWFALDSSWYVLGVAVLTLIPACFDLLSLFSLQQSLKKYTAMKHAQSLIDEDTGKQNQD